jgi:hypothetical protein
VIATLGKSESIRERLLAHAGYFGCGSDQGLPR